jgi:hypothetical protein
MLPAVISGRRSSSDPTDRFVGFRFDRKGAHSMAVNVAVVVRSDFGDFRNVHCHRMRSFAVESKADEAVSRIELARQPPASCTVTRSDVTRHTCREHSAVMITLPAVRGLM